MKVIVRTLQGLEEVLAGELTELGAADIQILTRAVACDMNKEQLYQSNHLLKTAIKIMVPIREEAYVRNEMQLYDTIKEIEWENIFNLNQTFSIDAVTNSEIFRHSHYAALKTKDAIADRFRDISGKRPFVNPVNPDIGIIVHIRHNILTVLMDATGPSLHLRGYRQYPVDAPLNEVLASGLVALSGWDKTSPLADPMCGSGTILIEAAMWAGNLPAQLEDRTYCFMNWKDFDKSLWKKVLEDARNNIRYEQIPPLFGRDKQLKSVSATNTNVQEKNLSSYINTQRADFFVAEGYNNATVIMNPPYDQRLKEEDIVSFYKLIGDKLKKDYRDSQVWVLSGNIEAIKQLGLKPSKRIKLINGDLETAFNRYEIYEGTR